jgi:RNA polymerase sigma factor (sigma-70 family)
VEKLTHQELWAAHTAQDWNCLWSAAEPLVTFVVDKLIRDGAAAFANREELVAEGQLAAGELVREWQPLEGTFNTFLASRLKWRLQNVCRREMRRDRWIDDGADVENVADENAEPVIDKAQVTWLLKTLPPHEARMVKMSYGIGEPAKTLREMADVYCAPRMTIQRDITRILIKLSKA